MDPATWALFGVVGLFLLNQVVMRVPALRRRLFVFYPLLWLDVGVGTAVILYGLPGFGDAPAVRWVLGLLLFVHAVQNLALRRRWEAEAARASEARDAARHAAIAAKLRD